MVENLSMAIFFLILITLLSVSSFATVRQWTGDDKVIQEDINLIVNEAKWEGLKISFTHEGYFANTVSLECKDGVVNLSVKSLPGEKVSTIYHGLFKLGFLFPHPRWQVSPDKTEALSKCGKTFTWVPAFTHRGFHLHTLHPNEWVKGFLEGKTDISLDLIRWLARNRQNAFQLVLLRGKWKEQVKNLAPAFTLAKGLGISRGISNGAANQQQNHWQLIPLPNAITGIGDERVLMKSLKKLDKNIDFDFLSMEFGTSEFTAVNYKRALKWMELTADIARKQGKKLFAKIHVSTNQFHPKWGNFNFLARYTSPEVGLMPHTVMFYGLYDEHVPMYGNKNFSHMLKFIQEENHKRDIWYFPETSYWIGMDVDVPLFLTDYLLSRSMDMKGMHLEGIEGHMNFSTGHELGYWLFDWTIALNTDTEENFDPLSGLKLLEESERDWSAILSFQTKHFKDEQIISIVSGPNVQDELARNHRIHERNIMKEVADSPIVREGEILKLEEALEEWPLSESIKNKEIKGLLAVTQLRLKHALAVRKALRFPKSSSERNKYLAIAKACRVQGLAHMQILKAKYSRYPEAKLFDRDNNLTSYNFNYLWTAGNLHFWRREEEQVAKDKFGPFFMNIYNILDILL